jgi:hypothetical protein
LKSPKIKFVPDTVDDLIPGQVFKHFLLARIALVAKNEKCKFALIELAYQIKTPGFYRVVLRVLLPRAPNLLTEIM